MKRIVKYVETEIIEEVNKSNFDRELRKIMNGINEVNKNVIKELQEDGSVFVSEIKDIKYVFTENERGGCSYTAIVIIEEVYYFN